MAFAIQAFKEMAPVPVRKVGMANYAMHAQQIDGVQIALCALRAFMVSATPPPEFVNAIQITLQRIAHSALQITGASTVCRASVDQMENAMKP